LKKHVVAIGMLCVMAAGVVTAALGSASQSRTLTTTMPAEISNRDMQPIAEGTWRGLRLDARSGDGVAWWPDVQFANGTIELEILGKDLQGQSFVGVAFHGQDEKTFDAIYFRPFNFRGATDLARSHAVQYISHPTYTWDKLRGEHTDRYESAIAPPPDPTGWFHARIEVQYRSVRVFVNDIATPVLEVQQLSERKTGWVGVWVGNGSDGAFANLVIRPPTP
jgi:hypothetical protein